MKYWLVLIDSRTISTCLVMTQFLSRVVLVPSHVYSKFRWFKGCKGLKILKEFLHLYFLCKKVFNSYTFLCYYAMNDTIGLYEISERSNTSVVIQDSTLTSRVYFWDVTSLVSEHKVLVCRCCVIYHIK